MNGSTGCKMGAASSVALRSAAEPGQRSWAELPHKQEHLLSKALGKWWGTALVSAQDSLFSCHRIRSQKGKRNTAWKAVPQPGISPPGTAAFSKSCCPLLQVQAKLLTLLAAPERRKRRHLRAGTAPQDIDMGPSRYACTKQSQNAGFQGWALSSPELSVSAPHSLTLTPSEGPSKWGWRSQDTDPETA